MDEREGLIDLHTMSEGVSGLPALAEQRPKIKAATRECYDTTSTNRASIIPLN